MSTVTVIRTAIIDDTYCCEILSDDQKGTGQFVYINTTLYIPALTRFTITIPE